MGMFVDLTVTVAQLNARTKERDYDKPGTSQSEKLRAASELTLTHPFDDTELKDKTFVKFWLCSAGLGPWADVSQRVLAAANQCQMQCTVSRYARVSKTSSLWMLSRNGGSSKLEERDECIEHAARPQVQGLDIAAIWPCY
eukprot:TRINITY_DN12638_c1_g2_i1.p1 TRINITY_DN12638_c1_g2~~TRINITY_DN12638_c1_g2_i1.p1  ORF type:complete len:141 (+),score=11.31 TRINITY_DN12638_c1_g2_i1:197-619(+)